MADTIAQDPTNIAAVNDAVGSDESAAPVDYLALSIGLCRRLGVCPDAKFPGEMTKGVVTSIVAQGAQHELKRLLNHGVREETIAVAAFFLNGAPILDEVAKTMFGDLRERKRKAKVMHSAIDALSGLEKLVDPDHFLPPAEFLQEFGYPLPSSTADGLRTFANLPFLRDQIMEAINANSGLEISKYTIVSAVYRVTGKYLDRDVSGVVGALLGQPDYDETAHRVWRIRTCPRLDKTISILPIFLQAFNCVLIEGSATEK